MTDLPSPAAREGSQQTLAQVVIETLGEVQGRDGDRAAYQFAVATPVPQRTSSCNSQHMQ